MRPRTLCGSRPASMTMTTCPNLTTTVRRLSMKTSEVYCNVSVTSTTLSQPTRRSPVRRVVVITSLLVVGLSAVTIGVMAHVPDDQIAPGVHVGNLDLSGKSLQDAR